MRPYAALLDDQVGLWVPCADGNISMARALRDVYDKLEAIERKIDAMSVQARSAGR
jgi:hypothetical protein